MQKKALSTPDEKRLFDKGQLEVGTELGTGQLHWLPRKRVPLNTTRQLIRKNS
jgi:hypothetical protein